MADLHTPGPWRVYEVGGKFSEPAIGVQPCDRVKSDICPTSGMDTRRSEEEVRANATLIAAAPDMLQALRDLLEIGDVMSREAAAAIINRATGKAKRTE